MGEMSSLLDSLNPELKNIIQMALRDFIKNILGALYTMIVTSLWLGVSLSLFVALLGTSSAQSHRKPIFILCMIAVAIGTIPSVLFLKILIQSIIGFNFAQSETPYLIALSFFSFFASICIDAILLFRLVAVFPPSIVSRRALTRIFGPLLMFKLARLTTTIVLVVRYLSKTREFPSYDPINFFLVVKTIPELRLAWSLQITDNALCSFLFIYRLHRTRSFSARLRNSSYGKRLRTLLLITVSNFVLPVVFVIVELGVVNSTSAMALAGINVSATNIEVIGVLFATIWASQEVDSWNQGEAEIASKDIYLPTISIASDRLGGEPSYDGEQRSQPSKMSMIIH
ncbi:hypothetical protein VKT23_017740 [Stygiomarasmius scandens]|uniref:Uncharacterized protein n=1 Tax=Marasmiellus scandens TaxID=2682957 RepID=A0ABR1IR83_9AGAR